MTTNVELLMEQEICDKFEKLKRMEAGTEEYSRLNNDLAALIGQYHEFIRAKEDNKQQWAKIGVTVGSTLLALAFYQWSFNSSMEFEKTNTWCTNPGKSLANGIVKMLPKIHL